MVKLAMAVGRDEKKTRKKNEERDFSLLVPATRILYQRKWLIHVVGFQPTTTNTLELELSPLDCLGTNACTIGTLVTTHNSFFHATTEASTITDTYYLLCDGDM